MQEQSVIERRKQPVVSQDLLREYVAGAEEMETQIYTLEETIKKHQEERDRYRSQNQRAFDAATRKYEKFQETVKSSQERMESFDYKTFVRELQKSLRRRDGGEKALEFIGYVFLLIFTGGPTIGPLTFWLVSVLGNSALVIVSGILIGLTLWFTIFFNLRKLIRKKDFKNEKNAIVAKYNDLLSQLECERMVFAEAKKTYDEGLASVKKLNEQIEFLEKTVQDLKNNLSLYYQSNLIPPDYRNLSCTVCIHYVFRNDQADTMREATLLCDQRIRSEIFIDAMRDLAETMRGIGTTLNYILGTIDSISSDVKDLATSQSMLASETKATRYATEAMQRSSERLEWKVMNDHLT